MKRNLWISIALMAALFSACVSTHIERSSYMPIAATRMQAVGTAMTVEGVVSVASGSLDEGFAVQDASGGIYVSRTPGVALKLGDTVRVSGKVLLPGNQQVAIDPATVDVLGGGDAPAPHAVKTGAVGPATEGRLIRVQGRMAAEVEDDQPWGWKIYLDDGSGRLLVFVNTATRIDVKPLRAGRQLRVTGFSGRYEKHTEVLPRGASDIVILGGP